MHVWQKFYSIWESYSEEEAFCLGRIACFGLLNISRLVRQLCQHQAHAINHQSTKYRTPDFHNRQNGTSRESSTFPIRFLQLASKSMFSIDSYMYEKNQVIKKQQQQQKHFFSALFWTMGKPRTLVTLSAMFFFFFNRTFTSFNFFVPGFALLYALIMGFYILTWYLGKRNRGVKGFLENLSI